MPDILHTSQILWCWAATQAEAAVLLIPDLEMLSGQSQPGVLHQLGHAITMRHQAANGLTQRLQADATCTTCCKMNR